jgi:histidyl-tRNA synthetase
MSNTAPQTLKGFRDFLPAEKIARDYVAKKITKTFELFGFEPLETPTLEYASLLLGKYGEEADKLVYTFEDKGKRQVGLRYDQTVPTARVLSQYQHQLPKYFRRYQIQNVFRADKPQRGRFREFTQCDIDIFGTKSPIADAEIIACTYAAFKDIGFPQIKIVINDRQVLFHYLNQFASEDLAVNSIIQTIDKLDKISPEAAIEELIKRGMSSSQAKDCLDSIKNAQPTDSLVDVIKTANSLGVSENDLIFNPYIARGLDYYTGSIFEIQIPIETFAVGSFAGGGRYDNLIEQLGGADTPAVGVAFGFDRIVEAAQTLNLIPQSNQSTQLLITVFDSSTLPYSLKVADQVRLAGIRTEIFPAQDNLPKQLKYANKKGIPFVAIIGPDEAEKEVITLKDMHTGEQSTLHLNEVVTKLSTSTNT